MAVDSHGGTSAAKRTPEWYLGQGPGGADGRSQVQ